MADATKALKVIDALQQEANSLAREEPAYIRPFKLGRSVEELNGLEDQLQAEITYVMDGPHTITDAGVALAEQMHQTVLAAWEFTDRGWMRR